MSGYVCPRCGDPVTKVTLEIGMPTRFNPCGHLDFSADLKVKPKKRSWLVKAWRFWQGGWTSSVSKDPWDRFLLRFWSTIILCLTIAAAWDSRPPRIMWGMVMGSVTVFFVLVLSMQKKR